MDSILDRITTIYTSLTKAEKKIADYIFSNKEEVQYLTITTLAEECHVAEATITRFCRKLDLSGYHALKLSLAKLDATQNVVDTYDKDTHSTLQKIYQLEINALTETLHGLDEASIHQAAYYLHHAHNVYCMGQGGSGVIAMEAWARFISVSTQFQWIQDSHFQIMTASLCTTHDVILFFSYSGSTKEIVDILQTAKHKNTKIILVTRFANCPAAAFADIIILCGSRESPLQSGSIAAKISQMYIIDVLFHAFCNINPYYRQENRDLTSNALLTKLL